MRIAVEGCCHGALDRTFAAVSALLPPVDLLIICGDVQTLRNKSDMPSLACPPKYRSLGSFHPYYASLKRVPVPTLFIGGNHEAWNYLWELYHGGWVCENMYFLGFAGVVKFGGLRIGGLSGIYKHFDFTKDHYEKPPFDQHTLRSIYHARKADVDRLMEITQPVDIFISHDWPNCAASSGDVESLLKKKPFFRKEVESETLGNPATTKLLRKLKPKRWFSAHLHVKYEATIVHNEKEETKFLALDKCLPNRDYLEVVEVETSEVNAPYTFTYDEEWLAIVKACSMRSPSNVPDFQKALVEAKSYVAENIVKKGRLQIQNNFQKTAPAHNPNVFIQATNFRNPQTDSFCDLLQIPNEFHTSIPILHESNPEEIQIDDDF